MPRPDDRTLQNAPLRGGCSHFPLGDVRATPGALRALQVARTSPVEFLVRQAGGNLAGRNGNDVGESCRTLSAHQLPTGAKLWIITEADHSLTTLLLPSEY